MMNRYPAHLAIVAIAMAACDAAPSSRYMEQLAAIANQADSSAKLTSQVDSDQASSARLEDFAGSWEATSDDGTSSETAEIEIDDGGAHGMMRSLERGYYSGRVSVKAQVEFRGTLNNGALAISAWDVNDGSQESAIAGRAFRREEYLVVRVGESEATFARPGVPLVKTAEGSTAGEALARAIQGRVYSSSSQASGRGGALAGRRTRLALCADGTIAFDVSDVATAGGDAGVDMGSSMSRRGEWGIVLYGGLPVVRAHWNGTGSSFSLTRYFKVVPSGGSSARIDGTQLPVTGSC